MSATYQFDLDSKNRFLRQQRIVRAQQDRQRRGQRALVAIGGRGCELVPSEHELTGLRRLLAAVRGLDS